MVSFANAQPTATDRARAGPIRSFLPRTRHAHGDGKTGALSTHPLYFSGARPRGKSGARRWPSARHSAASGAGNFLRRSVRACDSGARRGSPRPAVESQYPPGLQAEAPTFPAIFPSAKAPVAKSEVPAKAQDDVFETPVEKPVETPIEMPRWDKLDTAQVPLAFDAAAVPSTPKWRKSPSGLANSQLRRRPQPWSTGKHSRRAQQSPARSGAPPPRPMPELPDPYEQLDLSPGRSRPALDCVCSWSYPWRRLWAVPSAIGDICSCPRLSFL